MFTFFTKSAFDIFGIPEKLPEFVGYLTLIGAYLLIIGVAYYLIYRGDLHKNKDLILIGVLYKFAYCFITFYYFLVGDIPHILFLALFGVIDLVMFIFMLECYLSIRRLSKK